MAPAPTLHTIPDPACATQIPSSFENDLHTDMSVIAKAQAYCKLLSGLYGRGPESRTHVIDMHPLTFAACLSTPTF